jgi:hypothetical protein
VIAHVVSRNIPDSEQDTLSFVIARAVLMGLTEIPKGDGAVNSRNNV